MNSESQKSDRLKSILEHARAQTAAQQTTPRAPREAAAADLVDRDAGLPDPLALARLYQSSDLRTRLPEDATGDGPLPARDPGPEPGAPTRPAMTPSEMRQVMAELQATFQVSERSYETFEPAPNPVDNIPMPVEAERELELAEAVEAAGGGTGLYILGAGVVLVVVVIFILLAVNSVGPFKPVPDHSPLPAASASP